MNEDYNFAGTEQCYTLSGSFTSFTQGSVPVLFMSSGSLVHNTSECCIYGLVNHTTGKWYIGQTVNLSKRVSVYRNHDNSRKKQRIIDRAITKYGIIDFSGYILCECNKYMLNDLECYYGMLYHSLSPSGYNLSLGNGRDHTRSVNFNTHNVSRVTSENWKRTEYREKVIGKIRQSMSTPEYRKRCSDTVRKTYTAKLRQHRSRQLKMQWQDESMKQVLLYKLKRTIRKRAHKSRNKCVEFCFSLPVTFTFEFLRCNYGKHKAANLISAMKRYKLRDVVQVNNVNHYRLTKRYIRHHPMNKGD